MFAYVGLRNALPHSSDRNDGGHDGVGRGWERGDDGVRTARSAGAARLYNLRLPTEGLRQGHGLAFVAGARILQQPRMGLEPMTIRLRSACSTS